MADRAVDRALTEAARELREERRMGATWGDAHLVTSDDGRVGVIVDSSLGFDESRHPSRGKSARPATTIFVEVR